MASCERQWVLETRQFWVRDKLDWMYTHYSQWFDTPLRTKYVQGSFKIIYKDSLGAEKHKNQFE